MKKRSSPPKWRKLKTISSIKKPFTFLEISIFLCLILLVSTFLGIKSVPLIREYRFISSVNRLKSSLQLAKQLAINTRSDIFLELTQSKEGIYCEIINGEKERLLPGQVKIQETFPHLYLQTDDVSPMKKIGYSSTGKVFFTKKFLVFSSNKDHFEEIVCSFSCEKDRR